MIGPGSASPGQIAREYEATLDLRTDEQREEEAHDLRDDRWEDG
jgi:hypothetical protein